MRLFRTVALVWAIMTSEARGDSPFDGITWPLNPEDAWTR